MGASTTRAGLWEDETLIDPFKGTLKGTLIDPFKGTLKGTLIDPFKGTLKGKES